MNLALDARRPLPAWRRLPIWQQPEWPDPIALRAVVDQLSGSLPLVFPAECDLLKQRLATVARGEAFLLQGGDCAESFGATTTDSICRTVHTLRQMATMLSVAVSVPVVTVGRIAGQYAKPRSSPTETVAGVTLPAYRGDAVNGVAFTESARVADPDRLLRAYQLSVATMNLIRAITANVDEFFVSHEGLLLDYESALTRADPRTGRLYATSAHLLWIGERTRQLDGAHVEFFAGVDNPIAVKIGPTATGDEILRLIDRLDPDREPGRLTLVVRMGADKIEALLPELVRRVKAEGAPVAWVCDPMHGNTVQAPSGHKTRYVSDLVTEITGFFEVHRDLGTNPGGLHVEMTGENVTECVGGPVGFEDLPSRYRSVCDPRLNHDQSVDLARWLSALLDTGRQSQFPASGAAGPAG